METEQNVEKAHRLLTAARVHQMRGNLEEAYGACQEAVALDPSNAAAQEILGDLQAARGELDAAIERFRASFRLDPRPAVEEKIALMALRIDEKKRGGYGTPDGILDAAPRKRVNPSVACALSLLFPGMGQFHNGEYKKGLVFLVLWMALLPYLYLVVMAFLGPLFGQGSRHASGGAWLLGLVAMGIYVTALTDASLSAVAINRGNSPREKSGWEV